MKSQEYNWDNCCKTVSILGLDIIWWHRVEWPDGFFQPAWLEFVVGNRSLGSFRMGRYHPWGPTAPRPFKES